MVFRFQQTIPRPPEEDKNWYEWNNKNWGTKWDVQPDRVQINDLDANQRVLIIYCDTAWLPPAIWARNAAIKFDVTIEIHYEEPNNEYYGNIMATKHHFEDVEVDVSDLEDESEGDDEGHEYDDIKLDAINIDA